MNQCAIRQIYTPFFITLRVIDYIKDIPCVKITDRILQQWLDELEEEHSPKTLKNAYSLIHASLMEVLPRSTVLDWRIKLPTISKKKVVVPSMEEINTLLSYFKENDKDMYIVCLLSAFGTMRRSEMCGLTAEDVCDNIISINKALVLNGDSHDWILKTTKTEQSTRDVVMPVKVIKELPKEVRIVNLTPSAVTDRFIRARRKLNINDDVTLHCLRHFSASIMHELGALNETIMRRGGWSNDFTLNRHYRGSIEEYDRAFTDKLNNTLENAFMN